jgi:copper chaperone CopZ
MKNRMFLVLLACLVGAPLSSAYAEGAEKVQLTVKKMMCSSCADKVKSALMKVPGVDHVDIQAKANLVTVTYKAGAAAVSDPLVAAVKSAGFPATVTP